MLWIGFLVVHLVLGTLALGTGGGYLGDVTTAYKPWAVMAVSGNGIVGIDYPWVYPILAIIPILAPLAFGQGLYVGGWLTMVLVLDACAFAALLLYPNRRSAMAAWWWLAFLLLLGPVGLSRLDSVSVPIAIIALLALARRPRLAAILLTVATWVKVWPAALIAAVLVSMRSRARMIGACALTSVVVVAAALAAGGAGNVMSFVRAQTGRGLQIEAPVSTPWMWMAAAGRPGSSVYYDRDILTYQVTGTGVDTAAALMTPLLGVVVLVVVLVGIRSVHRGEHAATVLPALSLALVSALIAFNKVGSPQYMVWLVPPVILGLIRTGRSFRMPAILVLVTGAITQVIYPYWYDQLLGLNSAFLVLLSVRNALVFVLLGWSLAALWGQSPWSRMPSRIARLRSATLVPRS